MSNSLQPHGCMAAGQAPLSMEVFQARILQWGAISYFKGSSRPRDQALSLISPALAGGFFTTSIIWEAREALKGVKAIARGGSGARRVWGGGGELAFPGGHISVWEEVLAMAWRWLQ